MSVTITFRTDTDPFTGRIEFETAAVLQQVADEIADQRGIGVSSGTVHDNDGTVIGNWTLNRDDSAVPNPRQTNPVPNFPVGSQAAPGGTPVITPMTFVPPPVPLSRVSDVYVDFVVDRFNNGNKAVRHNIIDVYADNFDSQLGRGNAHTVYIEELARKDAANGPGNYLFRRDFIDRIRTTNTRMWKRIEPHMNTTI